MDSAIVPTMTGVKKAPPKRHRLLNAMRLPRSWTKYRSPTLALTRASNGARPTPWKKRAATREL